jgi:hypothetical protein
MEYCVICYYNDKIREVEAVVDRILMIVSDTVRWDMLG